MAMRRGTKEQPGEVRSSKYPGLLENARGEFRLSRKWVNTQGVERCANRYYVEKICDKCGKTHLVDKTNLKTQARFFCSKECRSAATSRAIGAKKAKRGMVDDDHVLVFVPEHPFANKTGEVPEHRLVMETQIGRPLKKTERVHHINFVKRDNRLNNRRSNIRECNRGENNQNLTRNSANTSGVVGVSRCLKTGKWATYINANGKRTWLGRFDTIEAASIARKEAKARIHSFQPEQREA